MLLPQFISHVTGFSIPFLDISNVLRGGLMRIRRSLCVWLILALVFLAVGCTSGGKALPDYGKEKPDFGADGKEHLLGLARATLLGTAPSGKAPAGLTTPYSKEVFVVAYLNGEQPIVGQGNAGTLAGSAVAAAQSIKNNSAFGRKMAKAMDRVRISVHVMTDVKKLKSDQEKKNKRLLEPGLYGAILVVDDKAYFQLGEQVIWECWGYKGQDRILGTKMVLKRLGELCDEASLEPTCFKGKTLYRFKTDSFIDAKAGGGNKALALYRGNVLVDKNYTPKDALAAAAAGGRNLAYNQQKNGKYGYIYYPCENKFDKSYNIVRHAGTTYAMFQIYKATGDPVIRDAALLALDYLKPSIKTPKQDDSVRLLYSRKRSDLGSNALLTLALVEMPAELLEARPEWKEIRDGLARGLLQYQMDDGSFYVKWKGVVAKKPPKKQPIYYPGEAFLAFVRMYEETGEKAYLDAAKKAADYQIKDFEKTGVPDNWVIQAYGRMYRQMPKDEYADACYAMADALLDHQWGTYRKSGAKLPHPDFYGGFDNGWPPRTTPAASRTEALDEAYAAAVAQKNPERIAKYAKGVSAAIWFDLNQQYRPENSYWVPDVQRVLGGFRGSPISNDIRIDYTQHTITGILHGLEAIEAARQ
jgi:hypothetical protein